MDNFYKILDFLTIDQAINWLNRLTGLEISQKDMLHLCSEGKCNIYVDTSGMKGWGPIQHKNFFESVTLDFDVVGGGIQEVQKLEILRKDKHDPTKAYRLHLNGPFVWYAKLDEYEKIYESWICSVSREDFMPLFKPMDIYALAESLGINESKNKTLHSASPSPTETRSTLKNQHNPVAHGEENLTFPYRTKILGAMITIANEYWTGLSPHHSLPSQKQVAHAFDDLLGVKDGTERPSRKAKVLAAAIKPDWVDD